jgi:hypothetical protein
MSTGIMRIYRRWENQQGTCFPVRESPGRSST